MRKSNKNLHILGKALVVSTLLLTACGGDEGPDIEHKYPDRQREEREKYGTISGSPDGFNIFGGSKRNRNRDNGNYGIGVNGYLWRASLDTLNFMPIASADPFGGVIITEWYNPPGSANERIKLNVMILDRQLRADGIKVSIFRQEYGARGWHDVATDQKAVVDFENAILTRARELKIHHGGGG